MNEAEDRYRLQDLGGIDRLASLKGRSGARVQDIDRKTMQVVGLQFESEADPVLALFPHPKDPARANLNAVLFQEFKSLHPLVISMGGNNLGIELP